MSLVLITAVYYKRCVYGQHGCTANWTCIRRFPHARLKRVYNSASTRLVASTACSIIIILDIVWDIIILI